MDSVHTLDVLKDLQKQTGATPEEIAFLTQKARDSMDASEREGSSQQREAAQEQHEINVDSVRHLRMKDQDHLASEEERITGPLMHWKQFVAKLGTLLGGLDKVKLHYAGPGPSGAYAKQRGLFVKVRGSENKVFDENLPPGWRYASWIQFPYMTEWGVLNITELGIVDNEKYRGWRTVLVDLIRHNIITEKEAHEEFGYPEIGIRSKLYRQKLYGIRNSNEKKDA